MPKYYFAIADMAEDENCVLCDAYMEVDFPYEVDDSVVAKFAVEQMPSLAGRLRAVSEAEYLYHTEEDADENT